MTTSRVTLAREAGAPAAARVLQHVRHAGVAARDEIAAATGLSVATVGRSIGQLVAAGLLQERATHQPGRVGRPATSVTLDRRRHAAIGVHVGRRTTTVALSGLDGEVLASTTLERPMGSAPDLEEVSRAAARLLGEHPHRQALGVGVVGPWREMHLDPEAVAGHLRSTTALPVAAADHVSAVAATGFLHRRAPGVSLHVYARDTIGFAVALDRGGRTEVTRTASLAHFPTRSDTACPCGRLGCLEVSASDAAVTRAAATAGLIVGDRVEDLHRVGHHAAARRLLLDRARLLGEVAGHVRDMVAPDRVVLAGQGFTGYPPVLDTVLAAYDGASALPRPVPVSVTRFGSDIQAAAACTIGLGPLFEDPLAVAGVSAPAARARRPPDRRAGRSR